MMLGLFQYIGNLAHDLSMTFGKAEKINEYSIIICINMNKIMNVLVDKVS